MYWIRKQFEFSASHLLVGLPSTHPCSRLHGHNYIVELVLTGELNEKGFVVDYRDLSKFKKFIDDFVDHRDLNEVFFPMQTTAENIAKAFYDMTHEWWHEIYSVRVSETPKTWAEYNRYGL